MRLRSSAAAAGSSPRGRGKPATRARIQLYRRLIPARAGKTSAKRRSPCARAAHPRAGGENAVMTVRFVPRPGSSPRGRGKLIALLGCRVLWRLIPARAGKTGARAVTGLGRPAHPRAGGENWPCQTRFFLLFGSSPRGRGKQQGRAHGVFQVGLIPARAGKTPWTACSSSTRRAHPRAGGENSPSIPYRAESAGSSPRGRGKLLAVTSAARGAGLIPARAGKTNLLMRHSRLKQAHPRAGGENIIVFDNLPKAEGSSPRGRGKPAWKRQSSPSHRLIPARAGKTTS